MAALREIIRTTLEGYAVKGANFDSFLTISPEGNMFAVIDLATNNLRERFTATSIVVHLVGDQVVIEHDDNDKPLVDALLQAGVTRKQIVLAYAGEPVPTTA
jgi:hypothetical protein